MMDLKSLGAVTSMIALIGCGQVSQSPTTGTSPVTPKISGSEVFDVNTCQTLNDNQALRTGELSRPLIETDMSEPLAIETVGLTHTMPDNYPDDWVIIHDANFFSMIDGRFILFDSSAQKRGMKGSIHGGKIGGFDISQNRKEMYVSTTYYSRGVTGDRTDILAIHDMCTFAKKAEVILPTKLGSMTPFKNRFRLSNDDKYAFAYNFTPASSVTIIDLDSREVVDEVQTPGCSLIYPMGKQGFASVCGDGAISGFSPDASGNFVATARAEGFADYDGDPMYMKTARIGDISYFVTFAGEMKAIDLGSDQPKTLKSWKVVSAEEYAEGWRPSGWHPIAAHAGRGELALLATPNGYHGSHKDPGFEIWIISAETGERVRRMPLEMPAISMAIAGDNILVTNVDMQIDVYDISTGEKERTIGGTSITPLLIYSSAGQ